MRGDPLPHWMELIFANRDLFPIVQLQCPARQFAHMATVDHIAPVAAEKPAGGQVVGQLVQGTVGIDLLL